jgi:hypothetical protein
MIIKFTGVLDKKTGLIQKSDRIGKEIDVIRLLPGSLFASYVLDRNYGFHSSQVVTYLIWENQIIVVTLNNIYEFTIVNGLEKWLGGI